MTIERIGLDYIKTDGFSSHTANGLRHIKVLPYLSVVQAVEGSYDIALAGGATHNTGDAGFFIAPADIQQDILHRADAVSGRIQCRWVFLKARVNDAPAFDKLYKFPVIVPTKYKADMNAVFDRLFTSNNPYDTHICCFEILKLLASFATPADDMVSPRVQRVMSYIKEHYREQITVDRLAAVCGTSPANLFSVFKKATGTSPIRYLNNYRLALAVELLVGSDRSVAEIANAVGIEDSVYFNKLFRKTYQLSPTKYRDEYKNT